MKRVFHKKQFEMLEKAHQNNELAHAYLFSGPEGIGKYRFADMLAYRLLDQSPSETSSTPPDIIYIQTPLPIKDARDILKQLNVAPFQGKYKIVILNNAERLRKETANTLLKSLEEPKKHTIFFLVTAHPEMLLETIRSRCLEIKFNYVPDVLIEKWLDTTSIQSLKIHWSGRPRVAAEMLEDNSYKQKIEAYKKDCGNFLKLSMTDRFKIAEKYATIQEKDELLEALKVWMEHARTEKANQFTEDLFRVYKSQYKTNANIKYSLNNLAVQIQ